MIGKTTRVKKENEKEAPWFCEALDAIHEKGDLNFLQREGIVRQAWLVRAVF
jgi:hypothetical protein